MSTSHTDNSHEEAKQQTDQNLLVARQKHHCTPTRVQNLKRNLMMESSKLIHLQITSCGYKLEVHAPVEYNLT